MPVWVWWACQKRTKAYKWVGGIKLTILETRNEDADMSYYIYPQNLTTSQLELSC